MSRFVADRLMPSMSAGDGVVRSAPGLPILIRQKDQTLMGESRELAV